MEKTKNILALVGIGLGVGVILTLILMKVFDARPSSIKLGPVEFDIPTATAALETKSAEEPIQVTITSQQSTKLIGHRQIADTGTEELVLANNQVAIGTADKFQDVMQYNYPPFTIFVIYGSISVQISMYWGGWDLWENASESFIEEQISGKIQEVIGKHPTDYDTRGYRVIKCYGQVTNCETMLTFP